jgi:hypothetical protein
MKVQLVFKWVQKNPIYIKKRSANYEPSTYSTEPNSSLHTKLCQQRTLKKQQSQQPTKIRFTNLKRTTFTTIFQYSLKLKPEFAEKIVTILS